MNKLHIVSILALTSVVFVSAQERIITKEMLRGAPAVVAAPVASGQGKVVPTPVRAVEMKPVMGRPATPPQNQNGGPVKNTGVENGVVPQVVMGVALPNIPTTGDPTIDAQIKVLILEREAKIKAMNDEYRIKIQALIGNRPLKTLGMMASSTLRVIGNEMVRQNASGTSVVRAPMMRNNNVQVNNGKGVQEINQVGDSIGAQFGAFFRGMFGGSN